ncbi:hypothetical protein G3O08_10505 [Cryomorpha ignava]|uniref:Universal stress protein n=1 Tax=Cryomorpha ignava TaxID=101383 RepID=A0A7K3WQJ6_9FLAO|nr:hypothetical protein [Cryomorpha ignava]NEN23929.1 hypothetical protein [Cryomorpha ignava]
MTDKKIILALPAQYADTSVFNLVTNCLGGENIHLTVCVYKDAVHSNSTLTNLEQLSKLCSDKSITLRLRILIGDDPQRLLKLSTFADLLILHQGLLEKPDFVTAFGKHTCPVIILPMAYSSINHVLLTLDGSVESIKSIKQFAQLFSHQIKRIEVTLLFLLETDFETGDEILLIEYLKQFCEKLGVLKIIKPLTERKLKPVKCDDHTLILSAYGSLIANYRSTVLEPILHDTNSVFFIPSET